jgi:hypothetical protein
MSDDIAIAGVVLTQAAAEAMDSIAAAYYRRQGTEWGGVTFGRIWQAKAGLVPVIEAATEGLCANASAGRCDILPESWAAGERLLAEAGRPAAVRIGTWHSHPRMRALPSPHMDVPAFYGYANVPHFVGIIVNPFPDAGPEHSCWGFRDGELVRLPSYVLRPQGEARLLQEVQR